MKLNTSVKSGTVRAVRHVWQMRRTYGLNWARHIHAVQAWVWIEQCSKCFSGIDVETVVCSGQREGDGYFQFIYCVLSAPLNTYLLSRTVHVCTGECVSGETEWDVLSFCHTSLISVSVFSQ